jgi:hypothetical protein
MKWCWTGLAGWIGQAGCTARGGRYPMNFLFDHPIRSLSAGLAIAVLVLPGVIIYRAS